ncbi:MAG TPA: methyltransferase domain-containing protein [Mycobacteriales bacterium]|jgi:precorrin-6B methylase 2|nr:methyltransferase domain-containing protein [Mycobacteriales bacterium]
MIWLPGLVERNHDLQNPTSRAKLRLLAERLRLGPGDHLLDVGAGRCGPAVLFASETGCRVTAVEQFGGFVAAARERAAAAGVAHLVTVVEGDGAAYPLPGEVYDVAACLGASFVYGGFAATLARLRSGVRPGGHVVVGEPYARVPGQELGGEVLPDLGGLLAIVAAHDLRPVSVITASDDDWDTYHSLHLLALEDWLDEHPDDPDAAEVVAFRPDAVDHYLAERALGWAVIAARVP